MWTIEGAAGNDTVNWNRHGHNVYSSMHHGDSEGQCLRSNCA